MSEEQTVETIAVEEEFVVAAAAQTFVDGVRRVLLASVGAVAIATGEAEKFVKRLIERGEIAEQDGRQLLTDLSEREREQASSGIGRIGNEADRMLDAVLTRMNIPTKSEIDDLSAKITELTEKIELLKQQQKAAQAAKQTAVTAEPETAVVAE